MHVGIGLMFQNPFNVFSDVEVFCNDLRLAEQAEPLGYDSIWTIEHHFTDYALQPDPLQFLTYMAGRTSRVQLGTMVVVLPWHDPVRVTEQIVQLDYLSGGRTVLGLGRGLGRIEFDGLRVPMGESRSRFVESAKIVLGALESGTFAFDGEHYQQPHRDLRPTPLKSFRGRTYASAVSPESFHIMAELGVGVLVIPQKPYDQVAKELREYRQTYRDVNGVEAPATGAAIWVFCDENEDRAQSLGRQFIGNYYGSVMRHYELAGDHFAENKGYEYYEKVARSIDSAGEDAVVQAFTDLHAYGTPEQCFNKIVETSELLGADHVMPVFNYSGMSIEEAERNFRLFTDEVLSELQRQVVVTSA